MCSKNFADKIISFLEKYNVYTDKDKAKIIYGLQGIYMLITKVIFLTIISLILGITKELYIFLAFYGIIRLYASGVHLSSSLGCTIASTLIFFGATYLCIYTYIDIPYRVILAGISICIFALYSPADTIKKPIIRQTDRNKKKIISSVLCYIYLIFLLNIKGSYILNALTYSLVLEAFMITPFAYKLFRQPYNNYVIYGNYKRKEE